MIPSALRIACIPWKSGELVPGLLDGGDAVFAQAMATVSI